MKELDGDRVAVTAECVQKLLEKSGDEEAITSNTAQGKAVGVIGGDGVAYSYEVEGGRFGHLPQGTQLFLRAASPQLPVAQNAQAVPLDRFIAEYGHKLAIALGIDSYDIADRDGQIKARMDVAPPTQAIAKQPDDAILSLAQDAPLAIDGWLPIENAPHGPTLLLSCETSPGKGYVCVGHYIERFTEESHSDSDNDEYSEEKDAYFIREGWYEHQYNWGEYHSIAISDKVVGWMPAPKFAAPHKELNNERAEEFARMAIIDDEAGFSEAAKDSLSLVIWSFKQAMRTPIQPVATQEDAGKVQAVDAKLRQDVKNALCIDGHLNVAHSSIMRSDSPDGTFCIIGALAHCAVDMAFDAIAASQPSNAVHSVTDEQIDWRHRMEVLIAIYLDRDRAIANQEYSDTAWREEIKENRRLLTATANAGKEKS